MHLFGPAIWDPVQFELAAVNEKPRGKRRKQNSVSREPEVVRAFRDTWKDEINSYLGYLRDRLVRRATF